MQPGWIHAIAEGMGTHRPSDAPRSGLSGQLLAGGGAAHLLRRFHRSSELPLQLLELPVDGALGLPPGQELGGIAGHGAQGIGFPQQGPQLVGPEPPPIRAVLPRQSSAEDRLVPGAAAIGPQQQCAAQAQQQDQAGAQQDGSTVQGGRRELQVPGGISIQQTVIATALKATTTRGQLLSRSSRCWRRPSRAGPSSRISMAA